MLKICVGGLGRTQRKSPAVAELAIQRQPTDRTIARPIGKLRGREQTFGQGLLQRKFLTQYAYFSAPLVAGRMLGLLTIQGSNH